MIDFVKVSSHVRVHAFLIKGVESYKSAYLSYLSTCTLVSGSIHFVEINIMLNIHASFVLPFAPITLQVDEGKKATATDVEQLVLFCWMDAKLGNISLHQKALVEDKACGCDLYADM